MQPVRQWSPTVLPIAVRISETTTTCDCCCHWHAADLMAYVECQRNFRACVKAHKLALLAQRAFWRSLMRDDLHLSDMLSAMRAMQQAEQTAICVYKRCALMLGALSMD